MKWSLERFCNFFKHMGEWAVSDIMKKRRALHSVSLNGVIVIIRYGLVSLKSG